MNKTLKSWRSASRQSRLGLGLDMRTKVAETGKPSAKKQRKEFKNKVSSLSY